MYKYWNSNIILKVTLLQVDLLPTLDMAGVAQTNWKQANLREVTPLEVLQKLVCSIYVFQLSFKMCCVVKKKVFLEFELPIISKTLQKDPEKVQKTFVIKKCTGD